MKISANDLLVIAGYFVLLLGLGVYLSRRKTEGIADYFVAGRKLPWYLVGTSMVAATFSADTPLAVTRFVAVEGVSGNWLWWNMAFAHLLAAVFFSKMWRRTGIITDAELIELRYSGRQAAVLRALKSFYYAVPINTLVIGWSILAMAKISGALVDFSALLSEESYDAATYFMPAFLAERHGGGLTVAFCLIAVIIYSAAGGLQVTARTAFLQFFFAVFGAVLIAWYAVKGVGGLEAMPARLNELYPERDFIALIPSGDSAMLPLSAFLTYIGVLWWAQKYSDGGGLIIQRMASAKDERHAYYGSLWFCFAHYALRSWPWILAGLAALIAFPLGEGAQIDREMAYPMLISEFLPEGLRGLAFASLIAAFVSTIDAQLTWGASYLVNDIYKRFIKPEASDRHYIWASRAAMLVMLALSLVTAAQMDSIGEAWKFLLSLGAGLGLVTLARWFWSRVNAASEIAALAASTIAALLLYLLSTETLWGAANPLYRGEVGFSAKIYIVLGFSTAAWLAATFLTKPTEIEKLKSFYEKALPSGPGWKSVAALSSAEAVPVSLKKVAIDYLLSLVFVFGALFGLGELLLGSAALGAALCFGSAASIYLLIRRK